MNVYGRVQLTLPIFSPELKISGSPVLFILDFTCFSGWSFNPSSWLDAWGADLLLLKPAEIECILSCQDMNFSHLPFVPGELDSAPSMPLCSAEFCSVFKELWHLSVLSDFWGFFQPAFWIVTGEFAALHYENWNNLAWRKGGLGWKYLIFLSVNWKEVSSKVGTDLLSQVKGWGNSLKLCPGRFKLDIRKKFLLWELYQALEQLHREMVELPPLESYKRHLGTCFMVDLAVNDWAWSS